MPNFAIEQFGSIHVNAWHHRPSSAPYEYDR